jgi:hypothetical protein
MDTCRVYGDRIQADTMYRVHIVETRDIFDILSTRFVNASWLSRRNLVPA